MQKAKTTPPTNPLMSVKEISDYEIRVKAMTLATQHSRNCQTATLIKIAGSIYNFLKGVKQDLKEE